MERALRRLSRTLRGLSAEGSRAAGERAIEQVTARLEAGAALGPALREALPALVEGSVEAAAAQFDSGAVALFIVDLRDALARRLERAAAAAGRREAWGPWMQGRLETLASSLRSETVEQHLINAVLSVTGLYAEVTTLELERLDRAGVSRAVTTVLQQSLAVVFSRRELAFTVARPDPGRARQPTPRPTPLVPA